MNPNISFELLCNPVDVFKFEATADFPFEWEPIGKREGIMEYSVFVYGDEHFLRKNDYLVILSFYNEDNKRSKAVVFSLSPIMAKIYLKAYDEDTQDYVPLIDAFTYPDLEEPSDSELEEIESHLDDFIEWIEEEEDDYEDNDF
jgi:hypothetical protein